MGIIQTIIECHLRILPRQHHQVNIQKVRMATRGDTIKGDTRAADLTRPTQPRPQPQDHGLAGAFPITTSVTSIKTISNGITTVLSRTDGTITRVRRTITITSNGTILPITKVMVTLVVVVAVAVAVAEVVAEVVTEEGGDGKYRRGVRSFD